MWRRPRLPGGRRQMLARELWSASERGAMPRRWSPCFGGWNSSLSRLKIVYPMAVAYPLPHSPPAMTLRLTYAGALPPQASDCSVGSQRVASHGFSAVPGCGTYSGKSLAAICRRRR